MKKHTVTENMVSAILGVLIAIPICIGAYKSHTKPLQVEPAIDFYSDMESTTEAIAEAPSEVPTIEEPTTEAEPVSRYRVDLTYDELVLLVNVVMAESGNQSLDGQIAVAETIINRVLSDKFPNTVTDVIYAEDQYATVFKWEPTESCWEAVWVALNGQTYPENMYYFRTKHFHAFGEPYKKIGDHYFSLG